MDLLNKKEFGYNTRFEHAVFQSLLYKYICVILIFSTESVEVAYVVLAVDKTN